jgi:Cu(I)/Ag(I) efflux system membrane protein CusA/SilA
VLDAVEISIGGKNVSTTIEGRRRFPIQVRVQRGERDDIDALGRILVSAPPGMGKAGQPQGVTYIPLSMVAKITREVGVNEIASENGLLRSFVQANVQGRDLGALLRRWNRNSRAWIGKA